MDIPAVALLLAGFTLAHAIWSVSDTKPDELLVPLVIVEHDGQRSLQRFEAATQLEAITAAKAATTKLIDASSAWTFAREGSVQVPAPGQIARDVISVDVWARGMTTPVTIMQQFERASASHGFRIIGAPMMTVGGTQLGDVDAEPHLTTIKRGIMSHAKAGPLWDTWK